MGQTKTFTYDLARNLLLVVDAKGQRIEFTYDVANRLVQKVLKDSVGTITDTVAFTYDSLGNLATANDSDSGLTFTYDALSRLTQAQTAATVAQPATSITYTYDNNGNRLTMTDPQAGVTNYLYDALNRLTSLTSPQGTSTFNYDALSRRTVLNLPNGSQASYTYDAASQLTELLNTVGATTISRFAYTYDAVGNRITRTTTNGIANYTYDALDRLTQATQPDPVDPLQQLTETFVYDPVGNRTSSHLATGQVHDAANRLSEDSNFIYTYDANGNLATKTSRATGEVTTYTYDAENQLTEVTSTGLVATYQYDALGRRIEKVVNGVAARYVYDNEDILLEFDGLNVVQAHYTHGPGIDEPLIMARGGQSFFYHADGLGSIWDLTDAAGTAVRSYTYDSFGQHLAQAGALDNPYTYTAREFDPETALLHYRTRDYMTSTGRFLQQDPIGILSGLNFYTYVGNKPIVFADPFGLQRERPLFKEFLDIFEVTGGLGTGAKGKVNLGFLKAQAGAEAVVAAKLEGAKLKAVAQASAGLSVGIPRVGDLGIFAGTEAEFFNTCEGLLSPPRVSEPEIILGLDTKRAKVVPIKIGAEATIPLHAYLPLSVKHGFFINLSEAADFIKKASR